MPQEQTTVKLKCPGCGEPLAASAPHGLCPLCLVREGLGEEAEVTSADEDAPSPGNHEQTVTVIGRYKLLERIGAGGMGMVYMAEQREPVVRKVALKIIKLGMDTEQVIARFEAERQALALMEHPNIARVLDAGATHSGRPYFVMELVRGVPITQFCDTHKLPMRRRLRLFFEVCAGIQHAHQKGIIHRDLKPSNILVTMNDDEPMVKIIDFGIAKATAQRLTERTLFTRFQQFVGTPAYMSPEQAQMNAKDADTRSDIYSLGVLLYELLTGRTPFDPKELMAQGQEAVLRHVLEVDPPRPSVRVSVLANEERTAVALARQEAPEKLRGLLRGDLDLVVMKALEKDRQRRYETANALAQDVRRYLDHEPVTAAAPSPAYKIRKFVQRNKVATAAITAVAASLILGLALALWSYGREREARSIAERDRRDADTQREVAEKQRQRAVENEENVRRLQYAVDVREAQLELEAGDYRRAKQILTAHIPPPHQSDRPDLRGWEWRYLWNQVSDDALLSNVEGEMEAASLSVSPDQRLLAVGRVGGAIEIFDAFTLRRQRTLQEDGTRTGLGDPPSVVAFVPRKNLLATAGHSERVIKLWDLETWKVSREIPYSEHDESAWSLRCSPDGTRLAMVTRKEDVQVLPVEDGVRGFSHPKGNALWDCLAFSPNGRWFASGGNPIELSDLHSDAEETRKIHVDRRVDDLAFSPDGSLLAGSLKSSIMLWNSETLDRVGSLEAEGHMDLGRIVFMDGGNTLVATSGQKLLVWDVPSRTLRKTLKGSQGLLIGLKVVESGDHLITGAIDGTLSRWSISTPQAAKQPIFLPGIQSLVTFSGPDRKWLTTTNDGSVALRNEDRLDHPEVMASFGPSKEERVAWSPHRELLAAVQTKGSEKRIKIWSREQNVFKTLDAVRGYTKCLTFFERGSLLVQVAAPAHRQYELGAWDTRTWERADLRIPVWKSIVHDYLQSDERRGGINALAVSPDKNLLVIGTTRGRVLWYDLTSGSLLVEERCHPGYLKDIVFSQDGKLAASGSSGVVLWQTDPPGIHTPLRGVGGAGGRLGLSADGARLVTGEARLGLLQIWDVRTSRLLVDLSDGALKGGLHEVGFLPGGKGVYARTSAGLLLWDAPALAEFPSERR